MANLIGGITSSHIPAVGIATTKGLFEEPYWKPFFDGYIPVRAWMEEKKPDVVVVVYNDHGLNFFLDQMPTFAVGAARTYDNADEGWGLKTMPPVPGDPELSWHIIERLVANEFDPCICQEMKVDHGLVVPLQVIWPDADAWPVKVVPVAVNTVQHPVPSAKRCYDMGKVIGEAIQSYDEDLNVVIFGTGGMSHQLQGERAGFINKRFDLDFMDKMVDRPEELTKLTTTDFVRDSGSEGVELIMWLMMRGALGDKVELKHSNYHAPISNTGAGVMVLEPVK
ncbi:MAG TPA: class III extradiol dioxygenase family protein [Magnetovibrio sp.]